MTRAKKIERIKTYRPGLYSLLLKKVPALVANPDNATEDDIFIYNNLIEEVAKLDGNNTSFKKNFSF